MRNFISCRFQLPLICIALSIVAGCNETASQSETTKVANKLPKMDFHKPKTMSDALGRLKEIHEIVISENELPAPRKYEVLEVIHGTGESAHSHYYLADSKHEDHDDHGHAEMETSEKTHQVTVDVFTEFHDIARWLPRIAAATDGMEAESWQQVKTVAAELAKMTAMPEGDETDVQSLRGEFRDKADEIAVLIQKLEAASDKNSTSEEGA